MTTFLVAAASIVVVLIVARLLSAKLHKRAVASDPRVEQMEKASEALTKGITVLTAILAIVAARGGGIGRIAANGGPDFKIAVLCGAVSVLLAFGSWIVVATVPKQRVTGTWLVMALVSVALFGASIFGVTQASEVAANAFDRPALAVQQTEDGLTFTASLDLLRSEDVLRTDVYGYLSDDGGRDLLFNSTTGADAEGHATAEGVVRRSLDEYSNVEVRAFRTDIDDQPGFRDPGCERTVDDEATETFGSSGCATIWIVPRHEDPQPAE